MNNCGTYCTEQQTCRAYEFGFPIEKRYDVDVTPCARIVEKIDGHKYPYECFLVIPTIKQMICWLQEKGVEFSITDKFCCVIFPYGETEKQIPMCEACEQAELSAIDAVLDYLSK